MVPKCIIFKVLPVPRLQLGNVPVPEAPASFSTAYLCSHAGTRAPCPYTNAFPGSRVEKYRDFIRYFLPNNHENSERIMLMMMQVVMGKQKPKFFFWMEMSPGIFPIKGILLPNINSPPAIIKIMPMIISVLPKALNSLMFFVSCVIERLP